ncbi:hypothetical protein MNEG_13013 [Monoraphidium neglectum]|uniref:Uncharacterized protein n=1 Tax=Monoraphidium neglectum TaxID=145388 RepID=A0A0D2LTH2_9CHLO|nr:hypothetical protein MNEG_13013 [Monoraphidium neglectum]KIY94949.1 hypothetical protein MNEG_13013 [Monoraphidium neglectum]|eukprot:XP_013893969.1 hypothetical protein MNEG_13013 [Monoraphidium neglectum]
MPPAALSDALAQLVRHAARVDVVRITLGAPAPAPWAPTPRRPTAPKLRRPRRRAGGRAAADAAPELLDSEALPDRLAAWVTDAVVRVLTDGRPEHLTLAARLPGGCVPDLAAALGANGSLRELCLAGSCLGDAGLQALRPALAGHPRLHSLDLSGCRLTDASAALLAGVLAARAGKLAEMAWVHGLRGEGGAAAATRAGAARGDALDGAGGGGGGGSYCLTDLVLNCNDITDEGALHLAAALIDGPAGGAPRRLELRRCRLTARGAEAVRVALARDGGGGGALVVDLRDNGLGPNNDGGGLRGSNSSNGSQAQGGKDGGCHGVEGGRRAAAACAASAVLWGPSEPSSAWRTRAPRRAWGGAGVGRLRRAAAQDSSGGGAAHTTQQGSGPLLGRAGAAGGWQLGVSRQSSLLPRIVEAAWPGCGEPGEPTSDGGSDTGPDDGDWFGDDAEDCAWDALAQSGAAHLDRDLPFKSAAEQSFDTQRRLKAHGAALSGAGQRLRCKVPLHEVSKRQQQLGQQQEQEQQQQQQQQQQEQQQERQQQERQQQQRQQQQRQQQRGEAVGMCLDMAEPMRGPQAHMGDGLASALRLIDAPGVVAPGAALAGCTFAGLQQSFSQVGALLDGLEAALLLAARQPV